MLENPAIAAKTTLIPLDLTHNFLATKDVQRALLYGFDRSDSDPALTVDKAALEGAPLVRRLFLEILTFFASAYASKFGITAGPPVHDLLAVAAAVAPECFTGHGNETFAIEVVTAESQRGRTKARADQFGVRIPRVVTADRVWRTLEECLVSAEHGNSR